MKRAYADAVRENTERTERALAESAADARPADPGPPRGHDRTAGREKVRAFRGPVGRVFRSG